MNLPMLDLSENEWHGPGLCHVHFLCWWSEKNMIGRTCKYREVPRSGLPSELPKTYRC
jgi:hypothetical protein